MTALEIVIAVAGASVTIMVVAAMVLLTPSGTEPAVDPTHEARATSAGGQSGAAESVGAGRATPAAPRRARGART